MTAKLKVGVLVVLVIASSAAFAASANTTAQIDRSSNVNVVSDSEGLISLQANTTSGIVNDGSGELAIDFTQGNAQGVNTNSTYQVGDQNSANTSYAFNITNQNSKGHDLGLDYTGAATNGATNIEFQVYDSLGGSLVNASEESGKVTTPIASGETVYVVLVVDTTGLDATADLSGTLTVSV